MIVPHTIPDVTKEMIEYAKQFDPKDDVRNHSKEYDKKTFAKYAGCARGTDCGREVWEITGLKNEQIAHFLIKYACEKCERNNEQQEPFEKMEYTERDGNLVEEIIIKG